MIPSALGKSVCMMSGVGRLYEETREEITSSQDGKELWTVCWEHKPLTLLIHIEECNLTSKRRHGVRP